MCVVSKGSVYVCVCDSNKTDECLQTAGEEEETGGSEGKAVGRKVWVLTAAKMKAI